MRFAIVVSRYNQNITQGLLDGALSVFKKSKIDWNSVKVVWVPGTFEIPLAAKKLALSHKYKAVIALGCILKGETSHNHYIALAASLGLMNISLETGIPVSFGILTPNNLKQALARSRIGSANKGVEAAEAAIEMAELIGNP